MHFLIKSPFLAEMLFWENKKNWKAFKACKKDYYYSYLENNVGKAKATWNGINILLSRKKTFAQPSKLITGDTEITDLHELSNAFNRHFTDVISTNCANL